jgi:hypothetical protein
MGIISNISIDSYTGFPNNKEFYHDVVRLIFKLSDYKERKIKDGDETYIEKVFESKVYECLDRLKIIGVTENKAKTEYLKPKEDDYFLWFKLEYENYLSFINECIYSGKTQYELGKVYTDDKLYVLETDFHAGQSSEAWLFSILQTLKPNSVVKYDLTFIINDNYTNLEIIKNLKFSKIIILTEGKTDTKYIKRSIEKLYPHLSESYHYMNFGELKLGGGASFLVHNIKSFIGSGINNKIIALFDNDTAGLKEMKQLTKLKIPENIKVLHYPNLELAKNYPTIGPNGENRMNVNGIACSIEMYLGKDVLKSKKNDYIPIELKGHEKSMNEYQGEISEKNLVQRRFEKKIKQEKINPSEWTEMKELINSIMVAWQ